MNKLRSVFVLPILALALTGAAAVAQDHPADQNRHDNHSYVQHNEWKHGTTIKHEDWDRGDKVDYRQNHLRRPASGYEWRMVDGHYVLANSNGAIVSIRRAPDAR